MIVVDSDALYPELMREGFVRLQAPPLPVDLENVRACALARAAAAAAPPGSPWDLPRASETLADLLNLHRDTKIASLVGRHCGARAHVLVDMVTVRRRGDSGLSYHSDTAVWVEPPFPAHARVLTFGVCLDRVTSGSGGTTFIPGSHKLRRDPGPADLADLGNPIEPECQAGDVLVWLGEIWHGRSPRTLPGERVYYVMAVGNEAVPHRERAAP